MSKISSQLTPYLMCAAQRYKRSVILWSPEKRLPGADTMTTRRDSSASTMALTLANCWASASDEPPNFRTLSIFLYSSSILAKNTGSPHERARSARANASATVMGPVQTVSLPVRR